jgi:hypothetical protein
MHKQGAETQHAGGTATSYTSGSGPELAQAIPTAHLVAGLSLVALLDLIEMRPCTTVLRSSHILARAKLSFCTAP